VPSRHLKEKMWMQVLFAYVFSEQGIAMFSSVLNSTKVLNSEFQNSALK